MAQPAETIAAISNKVFMRKVASLTWNATTPTMAIMSNHQLSPSRKDRSDSLIPIVNSQTGAIEALKAPLFPTAPTQGGPLPRGGTVDFDSSQNDTGTPLQYEVEGFIQPYTFPSKDIDVYAPASGNQVGVNKLVNEKMMAYKRLMQLLNAYFYRATHDVGYFPPFTTDIAATGTCGGVAQASVATWASPVVDMANARLGIDRFGEELRKNRIKYGGTLSVAFLGFTVHNLLVREAQARWANAFSAKSLSETFVDKDGKPTMRFEAAVTCWTIENCVLVPDPDADSASPTRVNVISPEDYVFGAVTNNPASKGGYIEHGPKNVLLEAGKAKIRGAVETNLYNACLNRRTQMAFTNCDV